jgi:peptide/nickel transport system substrate-binding protein
MKRLFSLIACAALAAAASRYPGSAEPQDRVRIGILQQPNSLNPLVESQFFENYIDEALFSGLTVLDDRGRVQPDLATAVPSLQNGGVSPDGKTIVYHLRPGAKWQDGAPVTADDVAFTFAKMRDPKVPFASSTDYRDVIDVVAKDPLTVVLHLRAPFADFASTFFVNGQFGSIVPKHILERAADMRTDPFGQHPVGSGPYVLERWDRGSSVVLKANPLYFRGKPPIEHIEIKLLGDSNSLAIGMRTGEIDMTPELSPTTLALVANVPRLRVVDVPTIILNGLTFRTDAGPFSDVRLRRAFSMAVDPARIVQTAYHGKAIPARDLIPPWSPFYTPAFPAAPDTAAAQNLLDAAGWKPGPGGIRIKNGQRLSVSLTIPTERTENRAAAVELQAMWRAIGAETTLRASPVNTLLGPDGLYARGRFEIGMNNEGFATSPNRNNDIITSSIPPRGLNYSRYSSPAVDALVEAGEVTLDPAKRRAIFSHIARLVAADVPLRPYCWRTAPYAVIRNLENFKPEPVNSDLWNVYEWRLGRLPSG